ncbi:hypothetical protein BH11PLA1_BH11PLA1_20050 [soil metagenome]
MTISRLLAVAAPFVLASAALAQTTVDATNKFAWGENIGWINFRDANAGAQGVRFLPGIENYMSGYAWGENVGFINFGDGTPVNGIAYANTTGADFGVNYSSTTGLLSGFAWGENIGWINFTTTGQPPAQQARYDSAARRLRGYAWGENVGWINLDVAVAGQFVAFVATKCSPADIADDAGNSPPTGSNNGVNEGDYNAFFNNFFTNQAVGSPADIANDDGSFLPPFGPAGGTNNGVNEGDYNAFFNSFFSGCFI